MSDPRVALLPVTRWTAAGAEHLDDAIAVERALEIRIDGRALAVTLRTPGDDEELAAGFLAGEGVVRSARDFAGAGEGREAGDGGTPHLGSADSARNPRRFPGIVVTAAACDDQPDIAEVRLAAGVPLDWAALERHFAATSACGLCGRAHLESLRAGLAPMEFGGRVAAAALTELSARLRASQAAFSATGGLHAAAFCEGDDLVPRVLREDVGRHNAVDKICGWLLREARYPAGTGMLWVSGRAGAEIVLKAARARVPVLAAVGAPTSLAVALARTARLTLVGFLRDGRMNVYCGEERIAA